jgi:hypothetical protein
VSHRRLVGLLATLCKSLFCIKLWMLLNPCVERDVWIDEGALLV